MLDFGRAVALLLGSWLLLGGLLAGTGRLVLALLTLPRGEPPPIALSFWLGWAATVAGLQVWHLARPVDGLAFGVLAVAGAAGLVMLVRDLSRVVPLGAPAGRSGRAAALLASVVACAVLVADFAIGPVRIYASGGTEGPALAVARLRTNLAARGIPPGRGPVVRNPLDPERDGDSGDRGEL